MTQILGSLRAAMAGSNALPDIESPLAIFAEGLGFRYYQIAWLRQPPLASGIVERPSAIGNIPRQWTDRYWQRRYYDDDCIVRACLKSILPITWTTTPSPELTDRQRRIAREAARFGLAHGVAIAVRGPGALLAVLTVARFREIGQETLTDIIDVLALGALALAATIVTLSPSGAPSSEAANLKEVECNCLMWAARGKSSAEIGRLLGMPERTVYFHIGNAMDRLGVATRIQAVTEAIKTGAINP